MLEEKKLACRVKKKRSKNIFICTVLWKYSLFCCKLRLVATHFLNTHLHITLQLDIFFTKMEDAILSNLHACTFYKLKNSIVSQQAAWKPRNNATSLCPSILWQPNLIINFKSFLGCNLPLQPLMSLFSTQISGHKLICHKTRCFDKNALFCWMM